MQEPRERWHSHVCHLHCSNRKMSIDCSIKLTSLLPVNDVSDFITFADNSGKLQKTFFLLHCLWSPIRFLSITTQNSKLSPHSTVIYIQKHGQAPSSWLQPGFLCLQKQSIEETLCNERCLGDLICFLKRQKRKLSHKVKPKIQAANQRVENLVDTTTVRPQRQQKRTSIQNCITVQQIDPTSHRKRKSDTSLETKWFVRNITGKLIAVKIGPITKLFNEFVRK